MIYYIRDPGEGFRLDNLPHAAISNPEDRPAEHMMYRMEQGLRPGGFGILLSRNLVDDLIYNEAGNELMLIKYLG
jgi:anti-sigma regulatory factor (Ser/Thr protein kinase)